MTNFGEDLQPDTAEPFIVRGHHATRLYNILAMGMSVNEVLDYAEAGPEPYRGYHRDVYGDTDLSVSDTKEAQRKFYEGFLNLDDDATVRFVAGQKDSICTSCVIGKHCGVNKDGGDARFLKTIGRLAREANMGDVLVEDEIRLGDRKSPSPVVQLPAWAAKKILSDLDFHAQTFSPIARPIARRSVQAALKKG